jgi:hypothetical protein
MLLSTYVGRSGAAWGHTPEAGVPRQGSRTPRVCADSSTLRTDSSLDDPCFDAWASHERSIIWGAPWWSSHRKLVLQGTGLDGIGWAYVGGDRANGHSPCGPSGANGRSCGAAACRLIGETSPGPEFSSLRHRQEAAVPEVRGEQLPSDAPRRLVLHHSPGRPMVVVCDAYLLSAGAGMPLAVLQHSAAMRNPARAAYRGPQAARFPALHLKAAERDPRGA